MPNHARTGCSSGAVAGDLGAVEDPEVTPDIDVVPLVAAGAGADRGRV